MPSYKNAYEACEDVRKRVVNDRQSLMCRETEAWLVDQCRKTLEKERAWKLDYCSPETFQESCDPYRKKWMQTLGEFAFKADFDVQYEPFFEDDHSIARWVYITLSEGLRARFVLALPKKRQSRLPLVIAQHGLASSPENVFGLVSSTLYHDYGKALLDAGFAVIAPSNITDAHPRARLQRLCLLLGKTIAGLEVGKIRRIIDYAVTLPEIDAKRIGMWGISLGGFYTMFTTPLEPRIKAGIICAFFNHRYAKMAVSSPLYSSFLDADEEHIWIPGWFSGGFSDAELLALICPRPVQIQQGRADSIGWWPLQHEEFSLARKYYEKLNIADRIEYADHQGGHEILAEKGISFLKKWL